MKYVLITGWKNDEMLEVHDTYAEAYNEFSESYSRHTTDSEMKSCYWYICEVSDSYAEQLMDDDEDEEYVLNVYSPCFSCDGKELL